MGANCTRSPHVALGDVGWKEGADEGGGEEGVLTGPIRH